MPLKPLLFGAIAGVAGAAMVLLGVAFAVYFGPKAAITFIVVVLAAAVVISGSKLNHPPSASSFGFVGIAAGGASGATIALPLSLSHLFLANFVPIDEMTERQYLDQLKICVLEMARPDKPWHVAAVQIKGSYRFSVILENTSQVLSLKKPNTREKLDLGLAISRVMDDAKKIQADVVVLDARVASWPDSDREQPTDAVYTHFRKEDQTMLARYVSTAATRISECLRIPSSTAAIWLPSESDKREGGTLK